MNYKRTIKNDKIAALLRDRGDPKMMVCRVPGGFSQGPLGGPPKGVPPNPSISKTDFLRFCHLLRWKS